MLLGRCEFGRDDYSLNIASEVQAEVEAVISEAPGGKGKAGKKRQPANQPTLFDGEGT